MPRLRVSYPHLSPQKGSLKVLDGNSGETGNRSLRSIHPVRRSVIIPAWSSNKLELTQREAGDSIRPFESASLPLSPSLCLCRACEKAWCKGKGAPRLGRFIRVIRVSAWNRHIKRPAWCILSHNWFVPRAPFVLPYPVKSNSALARTMGGLSFCDFSHFPLSAPLFLPSARASSSFSFSSLFLFFSYFTRGRSLARSKPVLAFVPSMLGFVFFSSNLARVNADGRFELFQFSRDEIQSRNRAEFPDLIFRGRRSLSGFVRISIKTSTNVLSLQITDMIFIT